MSADLGSGTVLSGMPDKTHTRAAVVIGSFLALCVTPLAVVGQTVGLFVGPVTHEFGWSRASFILGPSIAGLICGLVFPFLGMLGDRVGLRPVLFGGIAIFGLSLMAMSQLNGSVGGYLVLSIIMSVAGLVQTTVLYAKAISGWFADRRGLMLSIAVSGTGVGSILMPLFTNSLIQSVGWRGAYIGLGAAVILIAAPSVFFLVHEAPFEPDAQQAAPVATNEGMSFREACRTPAYWCLMLFLFTSNAALWSLVTNLAPILTNKGLDLTTAAAAMSALGVSQTIARLFSGLLLDWTSQPRVAAFWYFLATAGGILLAFTHSPAMAISAGLLIGAAWGAENELAAYFTSRYFGFRDYGLILGTFFAGFSLGAMSLGFLTAHLFDVSGSYGFALMIVTSCLALSCLFAMLLAPYRFTKSGIALPR